MNEVNQNVEQKEESKIDIWNVKFKGLLHEAQKEELFAPDVLFILQRAVNEIQHQCNSILFTHEHKINQEKE